MSKGKELNFEGQIICCGLDVHKTNWKVNSRMDNIELASFSQNPDPALLSHYFKKNYPGAKVKVVYEAGFCGFGIQRSLTGLGIECIVVNAADVPSSDKERKRKTDKVDARKLSRELAEGNLKGIYIPEIEMEHDRVLTRERYRLVQDQTRCKNRIKHMLMCNGIAFRFKSWSGKSMKELGKIECSVALKTALNLAIGEYKQIRTLIKEANEFLRKALIESSWVLIRKDPAMLMKYNEYRRRMNTNKAIIRIAKHLLARIRYVWNNQKEYERGIVG